MAYIEIPKTHYTPSEVARLVGVSRQTVVKLCAAEKLPSQRTPGGHWRIPVEAVRGVDGIDSGRGVMQIVGTTEPTPV